MVKRNAIATKLTKVCTQTQKWAFDVAVLAYNSQYRKVFSLKNSIGGGSNLYLS